MARAEKTKPLSTQKATSPKPDDELPPVVPLRKHPVLLGLALVAFLTWLGFLVALAIRG